MLYDLRCANRHSRDRRMRLDVWNLIRSVLPRWSR
jgi:hypothetical protein